MKSSLITLTLCSTLALGAYAQTPVKAVPDPNRPAPEKEAITDGTRGDGFYVSDSKVYMVRAGRSTLVVREMLFPNGLRVLPDGRFTGRDGVERTLLTNQWLNFQGTLEDYTPTVKPAPTSKAARESGVSSRDGITISGTDVFITRNGVTEKVIADVRLHNGIVAKPDGSVILANGHKIMLRPDQVLGLNGELYEAPIKPNPAGVEPASSPRNR